LRGDLIRTLGTLGNDPVVQASALHIEGDSASADANVLAAVVPVLAFTGDAHRYAQFLDRFRGAASPQQEQRYLHALGMFRQPELLEQTLARCLNGEIRTQDAPLFLRGLLMNVTARERAWQFVKANWDAINRAYPPVGIRRMMEGVIGLSTPPLEADVNEFIKSRKVDLGGKALAQYREQLRIAVALRQREGAALCRYLANLVG
jgi:hypothetical protein